MPNAGNFIPHRLARATCRKDRQENGRDADRCKDSNPPFVYFLSRPRNQRRATEIRAVLGRLYSLRINIPC